jgi:sugar phosphate isomerase/epimerase
MAKIPVGVQLYSVRDDCARDLPGTLKAIAKMGYAGVEFAGYYNVPAKELRKMLDDLGLKCSGTHIQLDSLLGDAFERSVAYNLELGNSYLIVPGLAPERRSSRAAWLETAALFNQLAQQLAVHGLRTGYHNHSEEFGLLEGEVGFDTGFDLFFGYTQKEVIMQLDIGHVVHGGADPLACLKRYPGRAATLHLQEYSAENDMALLGEGDVPLQSILDWCVKDGSVEWFIVEQEHYPVPPLEAVAKCLDTLRGMGMADCRNPK